MEPSVLRIKIVRPTRKQIPGAKMEMEVSSHQSRLDFWSCRAWKKDFDQAIFLPSDRYNDDPVEMDCEDADVKMQDLNA